MHHSQAQEYQADLLGVRYLGRTGYDVRAMAGFLDKLHGYSALENKIAGRPPGAVDETDFFASHPRTVDRVEQATAEASKTTASGTTLNRDAFLQHINGLLFGSSPAQGMVRGREFIHPGLMFRFEAPPGFRLINNPQAVLGLGPNNAMFQFDTDTKATNANPADYISHVWQPKVLLQNMERINVNGLEGATAVGHGTTKSGQVDVRFIAIKDQRNRMFRFLMATPPEQTQALSSALQRLTYSFRTLTPEEARTVKPLRVVLHTVGPGDTAQSLSARMATSEYNEDWFRLLNGLQPGQPVQIGQTVKLVALAN
jgi:predicted Zn-dependent protease